MEVPEICNYSNICIRDIGLSTGARKYRDHSSCAGTIAMRCDSKKKRFQGVDERATSGLAHPLTFHNPIFYPFPALVAFLLFITFFPSRFFIIDPRCIHGGHSTAHELIALHSPPINDRNIWQLPLQPCRKKVKKNARASDKWQGHFPCVFHLSAARMFSRSLQSKRVLVNRAVFIFPRRLSGV